MLFVLSKYHQKAYLLSGGNSLGPAKFFRTKFLKQYSEKNCCVMNLYLFNPPRYCFYYILIDTEKRGQFTHTVNLASVQINLVNLKRHHRVITPRGANQCRLL